MWISAAKGSLLMTKAVNYKTPFFPRTLGILFTCSLPNTWVKICWQLCLLSLPTRGNLSRVLRQRESFTILGETAGSQMTVQK